MSQTNSNPGNTLAGPQESEQKKRSTQQQIWERISCELCRPSFYESGKKMIPRILDVGKLVALNGTKCPLCSIFLYWIGSLDAQDRQMFLNGSWTLGAFHTPNNGLCMEWTKPNATARFQLYMPRGEPQSPRSMRLCPSRDVEKLNVIRWQREMRIAYIEIVRS